MIAMLAMVAAWAALVVAALVSIWQARFTTRVQTLIQLDATWHSQEMCTTRSNAATGLLQNDYSPDVETVLDFFEGLAGIYLKPHGRWPFRTRVLPDAWARHTFHWPAACYWKRCRNHIDQIQQRPRMRDVWKDFSDLMPEWNLIEGEPVDEDVHSFFEDETKLTSAKIDSIICTVISATFGPLRLPNTAEIRLSWANLGTRAALLHTVEIAVYKRADLTGIFEKKGDIEGPFPQVIEPGGMHFLVQKTQWDPEFFFKPDPFDSEYGAAKQTSTEHELFFVLKTVVSNPEGTRFYINELIGKLILNMNAEGVAWKSMVVHPRSFHLQTEKQAKTNISA